MVTHAPSDFDRIRAALKRGEISVLDDGGHRAFVRSKCPSDGAAASVYKTEQVTGAEGTYIRRVDFKCPACGQIFEAPAEKMVLR
ncbi:MAG: hypothetical protein HYY05_03035 [Chloroflexi bacterium]|nr:hypothetical protein [Chloroflexota bacterium]